MPTPQTQGWKSFLSMGQSRRIKPSLHSACGKTEYFPSELSMFGILTTHLPLRCQHRMRYRPTIRCWAGCNLIKVQLGQQPGVCENVNSNTITYTRTLHFLTDAGLWKGAFRLDFTFICRDDALACRLLALQISSGDRLQNTACFVAVLLAAKCSSYKKKHCWSLMKINK